MTAIQHREKNGTKRSRKILVGLWVEEGLVSAIDSAASKITFCDRSKYMRLALEEKLSREVVKLAEEQAEELRISRKVKRAIGNGKVKVGPCQ